MQDLNIGIALISFLIIILGIFNLQIQSGPVSETLLALAAGIIIGPHLLDIFNLPEEPEKHEFLHQATRFTLAMALMSTALRLPTDFFQKHKLSITVLLTIGMLLMSVFSGLIFKGFLGAELMVCMLLGAIVAPTDPVLSTTIVSGKVAEKLIPARVRNLISAESGSNDGLAFPYVMLPFLLISKPGHAWQEWVVKIILWETLGGIIFGYVVGHLAGLLMQYGRRKHGLTPKAFLSYAVGVAFFILGFFSLLGMNPIIGVFAGGYAMNRILSDNERLQEEQVEEMMERLFTIPIFVLFGASLPWDAWGVMGWNALLIPLAVLIFRRIPAMFAVRPGLKVLKTSSDVLFSGWFGPIGVAAIYYSTFIYEKTHEMIYWEIPALIIFASTFIHGFTSGPFGKTYHRRISKEGLMEA